MQSTFLFNLKSVSYSAAPAQKTASFFTLCIDSSALSKSARSRSSGPVSRSPACPAPPSRQSMRSSSPKDANTGWPHSLLTEISTLDGLIWSLIWLSLPVTLLLLLLDDDQRRPRRRGREQRAPHHLFRRDFGKGAPDCEEARRGSQASPKGVSWEQSNEFDTCIHNLHFLLSASSGSWPSQQQPKDDLFPDWSRWKIKRVASALPFFQRLPRTKIPFQSCSMYY